MAASEEERAGLEPARRETAIGWMLAAVVLREVALALETEREAA